MCTVRSTQGRDDYTQNSSVGGSEKHPRALTPCFLLCCVIRRGAQHQDKVIWPAFKCKLKNGPSFSRCCFEQHVLDCSDQCPVWSADLLLSSSARSHLLCIYMSSGFQVLWEVRVYFGKHLGKKMKKLFFYCLKSVMRGLGHCIPLSATFLCGLSFMWLHCLIS